MNFLCFIFFLAAKLQLGDQVIEVEIADTEAARMKGLSGRASVPDGTGMLFVFEDPQIVSFWMKDTHVPLSIAFFDSSRTLTQIADLNPPPKRSYLIPSVRSQGAAQYALEVPQGWFQEHKIKPGMIFYSLDQGISVN